MIVPLFNTDNNSFPIKTIRLRWCIILDYRFLDSLDKSNHINTQRALFTPVRERNSRGTKKEVYSTYSTPIVQATAKETKNCKNGFVNRRERGGTQILRKKKTVTICSFLDPCRSRKIQTRIWFFLKKQQPFVTGNTLKNEIKGISVGNYSSF